MNLHLRRYSIECTFLDVSTEALAIMFGMPLVDASILLEPHLVRGTQ